jgi:regulation of enolase protein 1 (concanavalin A-like superfamily)
VNGSGSDIWGTTDQLQYVNQPLIGDGTITARVTSQSMTDPWAKSGITIKESTTAGSPYVLLAVTPSNGIHLQWGYNSDLAGGSFTFPSAWLRLTRSGNVFSAFTSIDGTVWTLLGQATVAMNASATAGLVVDAHRWDQLNTSTFANVSVAGALPAGWTDADIGSPTPPGSSSYAGGTFSITGGGSDIWGGTDQFHYVYQQLSGNGSITARLVTQQNTSTWAKSGVMIKQSTTAGSAYAALLVTPSNGLHLQYGFNADQTLGGGTTPAWLRLTRSGSTVTAYTSTDGTTWIQAGTPITLALTAPATIGLFVCSHNGGTAGTSTFDQVSVGP